MAATAIDHRQHLELLRLLARLTFAAVITIALLAAAFVIGRVTAPAHTVRPVVAVPAVSTATPADMCRVGRPC